MSGSAKPGAVGLKVCIRCRDFAGTGEALGILVDQRTPESGEVTIINEEYERETGRSRYPFNYTWWSAKNYRDCIDPKDADDIGKCSDFQVIDQAKIYDMVGSNMMDELLHGQAIVMFAYGLSGAGKTYTIFGTDDPHSPHAWYKFSKPHEHWGLFPRIAYRLLRLCSMEGNERWKVKIKYFQNVVDQVIDLLSPAGTSKNFHHGMHKDRFGFMDVQWCKTVEVESWPELLAVLTAANRKKKIAPTQFNPSSTRGHCILFFELDMPDAKTKGVTTTARMYVCDLAGSEPSADIFYAQYSRKMTGGKIQYRCQGKHPDKSKTVMLQKQGKHINLSLSEMSMFFKKMSTAMKRQKNSLKPGQTVLGCNNYFLGKFLKDTMLQAHTYLFAAVRPELAFQSYTRSTLDFATNASVVKLLPKRMNIGHEYSDSKAHIANISDRGEVAALLERCEKLEEESKDAKLGFTREKNELVLKVEEMLGQEKNMQKEIKNLKNDLHLCEKKRKMASEEVSILFSKLETEHKAKIREKVQHSVEKVLSDVRDKKSEQMQQEKEQEVQRSTELLASLQEELGSVVRSQFQAFSEEKLGLESQIEVMVKEKHALLLQSQEAASENETLSLEIRNFKDEVSILQSQIDYEHSERIKEKMRRTSAGILNDLRISNTIAESEAMSPAQSDFVKVEIDSNPRTESAPKDATPSDQHLDTFYLDLQTYMTEVEQLLTDFVAKR